MQPDVKAEPKQNVDTASQQPARARLRYEPPVLTKYGDVVTLTRGVTGAGTDNAAIST